MHDNLLAGPVGERYHDLSSVRARDTLDFIYSFLSTLEKDLHDDSEKKKTVQVKEVKKDNRSVYGWVEYGEYGIPGFIVDTKSKQKTYTKKHDDSEVRLLYFNFCIPLGSKTGIALLHTAGNRGIKTFFYEKFSEYFHNMLSLRVQMRPLSHEKTVQEWIDNSDVKEIRLGKYLLQSEGEDIADRLGVERTELILKPKRGRGFGNIRGLREKVDGSNKSYVEILSSMSADVKAVVESGGRKKVLSLKAGEPVAAIEIDESTVDIIDGAPEKNSLHRYAQDLMKEFIKKV